MVEHPKTKKKKNFNRLASELFVVKFSLCERVCVCCGLCVILFFGLAAIRFLF
jgi:hypothetical protein